MTQSRPASKDAQDDPGAEPDYATMTRRRPILGGLILESCRPSCHECAMNQLRAIGLVARPSVLAFLLFVATHGCGASPAPETPPPTWGSPCAQDADCGGSSLLCGVDATGASVCVGSCPGPYAPPKGSKLPPVACWNGRQTPCEQLPPAQTCGCGCPDGTYCLSVPDGTQAHCVPLLGPGAACELDLECASSACVFPSGSTKSICSVPLGGACTDANCGLCLHDGAKTTCTMYCGGGCPDGWTCVAFPLDTRTTCHQNCDGQPCPAGVCTQLQDGHYVCH